MKEFVVITCPSGIFIQKNKRGIPRHVIHSTHDAYEAAKQVRDELRTEREEAAAKAHDKWHDAYNRAVDRGDWPTICRLTGIPS